MSQLLEDQMDFAEATVKLLAKIIEMGYRFTWGHAMRCDDCNTGSPLSKHRKKLAIDINLFKDGVYLSKTEHHAIFGKYWKSLGGEWGGDWKDGNHYAWPETRIKEVY